MIVSRSLRLDTHEVFIAGTYKQLCHHKNVSPPKTPPKPNLRLRILSEIHKPQFVLAFH